MKTWFAKNGLQLFVMLISAGLAIGIKLDYAHVNVYLGIASACGLLGIKLMPFGDPIFAPKLASNDAPAPKPEDPPNPGPLMMILFVAGFIGAVAGAVPSCTATKGEIAKTAVDLIACVDQNIDASPEQIALTCGLTLTPDVISLLTERKQIKAFSRNPGCTIIVVDAGAPDGAGK